jgi:hypothetical protein
MIGNVPKKYAHLVMRRVEQRLAHTAGGGALLWPVVDQDLVVAGMRVVEALHACQAPSAPPCSAPPPRRAARYGGCGTQNMYLCSACIRVLCPSCMTARLNSEPTRKDLNCNFLRTEEVLGSFLTSRSGKTLPGQLRILLKKAVIAALVLCGKVRRAGAKTSMR